MAAAGEGNTPDGPLLFWVGVQDLTLRRALSYVGEAAGWCEVPSADAATAAVCDLGTQVGPQPRRILVVDPTPCATEGALEAIRRGDACGALTSDRPDDLLPVVLAATRDQVLVPGPLVRLAGTMPELTDRQRAVLLCLIDGKENASIARELCLSCGSVKRELGDLFKLLGARNRSSLARSAQQLGLTR